jgi:hypothetical protein
MPLTCYEVEELLTQSLIERYHGLPPMMSKADVLKVLPRPIALFLEPTPTVPDLLTYKPSELQVIQNAILFCTHEMSTIYQILPESAGSVESLSGRMRLWFEVPDGESRAYEKLPRNKDLSDRHKLHRFWAHWVYLPHNGLYSTDRFRPSHGLRGRIIYQLTEYAVEEIVTECWAHTSEIIDAHLRKRQREE